MRSISSIIKRSGRPLQDLNYQYEVHPFKKEIEGISFRSYDLLPADDDVLLSELLARSDEGENVIDVGAHTGLYSLPLSNSGRNIAAFEPNPLVFEQLAKNVRANPGNVDLFNVGLGHTEGSLTFYVSSARARSSFDEQYAETGNGSISKTIEVRVNTLDTYVEESYIPKPDHIKIDVEGFGLEVLKGSTEIVEAFRPQIYIEVHEIESEKDNTKQIKEHFKRHDYEWERVGTSAYIFSNHSQGQAQSN